APDEPELAPPQIFADGTLTAMLLNQAVVRRVGGNGRWYGADGKPVDKMYYLDGKTTSDFFDAPTQHPPADELAAATAKLTAAVASLGGNKGTNITDEGRLFYAFDAGATGVRHYTANIVTLDVDYTTNVDDGDGFTGLVVGCRTFDPCAVGWS